MTEYQKGVIAGMIIGVVTVFLAFLYLGCGVVEGESSVNELEKGGILPGPDQRPPLPEGWSVRDGEWFYQELHNDSTGGI
jgi:hypothetical protein